MAQVSPCSLGNTECVYLTPNGWTRHMGQWESRVSHLLCRGGPTTGSLLQGSRGSSVNYSLLRLPSSSLFLCSFLLVHKHLQDSHISQTSSIYSLFLSSLYIVFGEGNTGGCYSRCWWEWKEVQPSRGPCDTMYQKP